MEITQKTVVKAPNPVPETYVITPSNLDLLSGRYPATCLLFYPKPSTNDFASIVAAVKSSLSNTLRYYYPYAGQIVTNEKSGLPEIVCNNHGILLVEAYCHIPLAKLDFYDLNHSFHKLVFVNHDFPCHVQIMKYVCGGVSVVITFDHALGDAFTFNQFLMSWCELAQGMETLSCPPDHSRSLSARSPPRYNPSIDEVFISFKVTDALQMPSNDINLKRLYYVDVLDIERLQRLSGKRTKVEAVSAYLWKMMVKAIGQSETRCKMGWLVDGRRRIVESQNFSSNYTGNLLSMAVGEATIEELEEGSIPDVANIVHNAISKTTNEDHFLDLIDWVECNKPGMMFSKILLGLEGPAIVLSSTKQIEVAKFDFGFGAPVLGTIYSTISTIGACFMSQLLSPKGDGSWVVFTIIWPALAHALEVDPDHIFQPMTKAHFGL